MNYPWQCASVLPLWFTFPNQNQASHITCFQWLLADLYCPVTSTLIFLGPYTSNKSNDALTCCSYESSLPHCQTIETQLCELDHCETLWVPRRSSLYKNSREVSFHCMYSTLVPSQAFWRRTLCTRRLFLRHTGSLAPAKTTVLKPGWSSSIAAAAPWQACAGLWAGGHGFASGPVICRVVSLLMGCLSVPFKPVLSWLPTLALTTGGKATQPPSCSRSQTRNSKQDFPSTLGKNGPQS